MSIFDQSPATWPYPQAEEPLEGPQAEYIREARADIEADNSWAEAEAEQDLFAEAYADQFFAQYDDPADVCPW
jgi:hypothetical protein